MLASKQVVAHQTSGGWSVVEPSTTASRGSLFRCSFDICDSYQTFSTDGGIHFGGDVPPSRFNAVAAQVEHDVQIGNTRVCELHAFCGVDYGPLHVLRIVALVLGKFEPRDYVVHRIDAEHESSLNRFWV